MVPMEITHADMTDIMKIINSLVARMIIDMEMARTVHTVPIAMPGQMGDTEKMGIP